MLATLAQTQTTTGAQRDGQLREALSSHVLCFEGALPTSSVCPFHSFLVVRGMRVTSMYTVTCIKGFTMFVPSPTGAKSLHWTQLRVAIHNLKPLYDKIPFSTPEESPSTGLAVFSCLLGFAMAIGCGSDVTSYHGDRGLWKGVGGTQPGVTAVTPWRVSCVWGCRWARGLLALR